MYIRPLTDILIPFTEKLFAEDPVTYNLALRNESKKTIKMKTLLQMTAIATLIVAFSLNLSGSTPNFELEEEAYINDIPFDTKCIAADCIYQKALQVDFEIEEEAYVDDIPFNTQKVVVENAFRDALNEVFTFEDELYIDDIPEALLHAKNQTHTIKLTINETSILIARSK
jgi:hypothetical protein